MTEDELEQEFRRSTQRQLEKVRTGALEFWVAAPYLRGLVEIGYLNKDYVEKVLFKASIKLFENGKFDEEGGVVLYKKKENEQSETNSG